MRRRRRRRREEEEDVGGGCMSSTMNYQDIPEETQMKEIPKKPRFDL